MAEDKAEAILLGCAGPADLMQAPSADVGIPVIDGISCAVGGTEAPLAAALSTSKARTYHAVTKNRTSGQALRAPADPASAG